MSASSIFKIGYGFSFEIGSVIYKARALYNLIFAKNDVFSDDCTSSNFTKSMNASTNLGYDLLKLYPNPAREQIEYEFEIENEQVGKVTVFSILGSTLIEFQVNHKISKGSIDLSLLSKGVYLFELNIDGKHKIIKQFVVN